MVVKNSKLGVHSGNTLRASNSRYNRIYKSQSVLVRHSDSENNVQFFDDLQLPDDDVVYSLNKRGRWRIPLMLKQKILYNHQGFGDTNITLIESHKMKKPSRCISYVSSKDALVKVCPKGRKTYFNVESISEQDQRNGNEQDTAENAQNKMSKKNKESNVTVNVLYPCPRTSSITHNPKYITVCHKSQHDVDSTKENAQEGHFGSLEVKNKKRNRKRINLKGSSENILNEIDFYLDDDVYT